MYRAVILFLLVSGCANALTLSPMKVDSLVYSDVYKATVSLTNTSENVTYYDTWIARDYDGHIPSGLAYEYYRGELALGGLTTRFITAPIFDIPHDKLEVYYLCVQERPTGAQLGAVGRVCSKLRLYYPYAQLLKLQ